MWLRKLKPGEALLGTAWVVLLLVMAILLAWSQQDFGWGRYENGVLQPFQGRLRLLPYPALEVERPLRSDDWSAVSVYPLVASTGGGISEALSEFDNVLVTLNARVLCSGDLTMLEVVEESVARVTRTIEFPNPEVLRDVSEVTLRGEIIDLKSFLGFREPEIGNLLRSPASSAIRSGVPPLFVVTDSQGTQKGFLLVDAHGNPAAQLAIGRVAVPLEIRGRLKMWGDFPVISSSPEGVQRIWFWD